MYPELAANPRILSYESLLQRYIAKKTFDKFLHDLHNHNE